MNAGNCPPWTFVRAAPIALSIVVLVSGCSQKAHTPTEARDVVRPVRTMVVSTGAESHERAFSGRVEAANKVELAFQVSGLRVSLRSGRGKGLPKTR